MIVGIGTDIIDNKRIEKTLNKYGNKFKKRCFLINEIIKSDNRKNTVNSFAKRYAAKEACAKALGTGLAQGVFWKDIEVINNISGKPYIKLHNKALIKLKELSTKESNIEVSLSDEKKYSIAFVIFQKQ